MNIFVASWFFPPSTSSEGIVAYKLLKHSKHQYDVCSSSSDNWGYSHAFDYSADNINQFLIDTDDIMEWVDKAIEKFEEEYPTKKYTAIMTRSMPPESIIVGETIKKRHPEVLWIASLGDPISRVPHMMRDFLDKTKSLTKAQKTSFKRDLYEPGSCIQWRGVGDAGVDILQQYKEWENTALHEADMVIAPNGPQLAYSLCGYRRDNTYIIPHSFDETLYPEVEKNENNDVKELVFLGFSNKERSLVPLVEAVRALRINNPDALKHLSIRFIGNITDDSEMLVYNYYLNDVISVEPSVSYFESLAIMKNADWLVHVDAFYNQFNKTGASIYFAGKLADYLGAKKPILALTGEGSPAYRAVELCGGKCHSQFAIQDIALTLEQIALDHVDVDINDVVREQYNAKRVGQLLDANIDDMLRHPGPFFFERKDWPTCGKPAEDKILTVCIPSYNVQSTLDRCLHSLISSKCADKLDILVVNDGSSDKTAEIAQAYQDHYPGIVTLVNKENGGHGSTINKGLELATGKYFRVLDGDDWFSPEALDKLVDFLANSDIDIDVVSTSYCQINMRDGKLSRINKKSQDIEYNKVYSIEDIDISKEYLAMHNVTYRTELLRDCNLKISEHMFYVDVEYQMFPMPFVSTIAFTKDSLYRYSVGNAEQSVSRQSFVRRYDQHTYVMKRLLDYFDEHKKNMGQNILDYYKRLIVDYFMATQFTIALIYDDDWERGLGRAKEFDSYLKHNHKDIYNAVGKKYKNIALARQMNYDPRKYGRPKSLNTTVPSAPKKAALKKVEKLMRGRVGDVVAREIKRKK